MKYELNIEETTEMLASEIESNVDIFVSLLRKPESRKWNVQKIAEKIIRLIVENISRINYSQNIVKETTFVKKGCSILIIVPLEEAKKKSQKSIEGIVNKVLSSISERAIYIEHNTEVSIFKVS